MAAGLLQRLASAISAKDLDAVISLFDRSEQVTMIGSEGPETAVGWPDVCSLWERVLRRRQGYEWRFSNTRVNSTESVAWIAADATVTIRDGHIESTIPYRLTLILRFRDGTWKLVQYHGSEPADPWVKADSDITDFYDQ